MKTKSIRRRRILIVSLSEKMYWRDFFLDIMFIAFPRKPLFEGFRKKFGIKSLKKLKLSSIF